MKEEQTRASAAPRKTESGDLDSEAKANVEICVLSPSSARKIMRNADPSTCRLIATSVPPRRERHGAERIRACQAGADRPGRPAPFADTRRRRILCADGASPMVTKQKVANGIFWVEDPRGRPADPLRLSGGRGQAPDPARTDRPDRRRTGVASKPAPTPSSCPTPRSRREASPTSPSSRSCRCSTARACSSPITRTTRAAAPCSSGWGTRCAPRGSTSPGATTALCRWRSCRPAACRRGRGPGDVRDQEMVQLRHDPPHLRAGGPAAGGRGRGGPGPGLRDAPQGLQPLRVPRRRAVGGGGPHPRPRGGVRARVHAADPHGAPGASSRSSTWARATGGTCSRPCMGSIVCCRGTVCTWWTPAPTSRAPWTPWGSASRRSRASSTPTRTTTISRASPPSCRSDRRLEVLRRALRPRQRAEEARRPHADRRGAVLLVLRGARPGARGMEPRRRHGGEAGVFARTRWRPRCSSSARAAGAARAPTPTSPTSPPFEVLDRLSSGGAGQAAMSQAQPRRVPPRRSARPVDLKKVDAGGGLIHGDAADFAADESKKILLSHGVPESRDRPGRVTTAAFGDVDVLIPGGSEAYFREAARSCLAAWFPRCAHRRSTPWSRARSWRSPRAASCTRPQAGRRTCGSSSAGSRRRPTRRLAPCAASAWDPCRGYSASDAPAVPASCRARSAVTVLSIPAAVYRQFVQRNGSVGACRRRPAPRRAGPLPGLRRDHERRRAEPHRRFRGGAPPRGRGRRPPRSPRPRSTCWRTARWTSSWGPSSSRPCIRAGSGERSGS